MLKRNGEDRPPCIVPTDTRTGLLNIPFHFILTDMPEYHPYIILQQWSGNTFAALLKITAWGIASNAPSAPKEHDSVNCTTTCGDVGYMTSFNNDVAVFVPRFGINPNCISLKLRCLHWSKTYNSKNFLNVDEMTMRRQFILLLMCHSWLSLELGQIS